MIKSIHIVTHCYAKELPQFARHLRYQISSLMQFPQEGREIILTVCTTSDDKRTLAVVSGTGFPGPKILVRLLTMPPEKLFRRAIGRNLAVQGFDADLVWFTDVDHFFRDQWANSLCDQLEGRAGWVSGQATMAFPGTIKIHRDHAECDAMVSEVCDRIPLDQPVPMPDPLMFVDKHYARAIGGVQIARGSMVRETGYLDGTKWMEPVSPLKPFPSFRDDIGFRKHCQKRGPILKLNEIRGLYRLRHVEITYR